MESLWNILTLKFLWGPLVTLFASLAGGRPAGTVYHHVGQELPRGVVQKFKNILIVDDIQDHAQAALEVVVAHYRAGEIRVYLAHGYNAALTFFSEVAMDLVILDCDLVDEVGDGVGLATHFLAQKPNLTLLANSSCKSHNKKLLECGARYAVAKNTDLLHLWLAEHERIAAKIAAS